jgi:hypothetical protein
MEETLTPIEDTPEFSLLFTFSFLTWHIKAYNPQLYLFFEKLLELLPEDIDPSIVSQVIAYSFVTPSNAGRNNVKIEFLNGGGRRRTRKQRGGQPPYTLGHGGMPLETIQLNVAKGQELFYSGLSLWLFLFAVLRRRLMVDKVSPRKSSLLHTVAFEAPVRFMDFVTTMEYNTGNVAREQENLARTLTTPRVEYNLERILRKSNSIFHMTHAAFLQRLFSGTSIQVDPERVNEASVARLKEAIGQYKRTKNKNTILSLTTALRNEAIRQPPKQPNTRKSKSSYNNENFANFAKRHMNRYTKKKKMEPKNYGFKNTNLIHVTLANGTSTKMPAIEALKLLEESQKKASGDEYSENNLSGDVIRVFGLDGKIRNVPLSKKPETAYLFSEQVFESMAAHMARSCIWTNRTELGGKYYVNESQELVFGKNITRGQRGSVKTNLNVPDSITEGSPYFKEDNLISSFHCHPCDADRIYSPPSVADYRVSIFSFVRRQILYETVNTPEGLYIITPTKTMREVLVKMRDKILKSTGNLTTYFKDFMYKISEHITNKSDVIRKYFVNVSKSKTFIKESVLPGLDNLGNVEYLSDVIPVGFQTRFIPTSLARGTYIDYPHVRESVLEGMVHPSNTNTSSAFTILDVPDPSEAGGYRTEIDYTPPPNVNTSEVQTFLNSTAQNAWQLKFFDPDDYYTRVGRRIEEGAKSHPWLSIFPSTSLPKYRQQTMYNEGGKFTLQNAWNKRMERLKKQEEKQTKAQSQLPLALAPSLPMSLQPLPPSRAIGST